ncbi:Hcp family type VI secretion system effector [Chengkuizengella sediminis]|uniref:Hcp family type VI secretion system effector n=1 Tax=Chengkuizengella sediminis TaxID=1885917 RepID=UPI00138A5B54|nr:type VI secretion system tube protein Hcp [Chengkuizengella sediminis]NDI35461.1 type VI secretion system tube protein Hcp [Chengkuizengella sediminis]
MNFKKNRLNWYISAVLIFSLLILVPQSATAAENSKVFLEIDGITGTSIFEGEERNIEVSSFAFGVARHVSLEAGNIANREATLPSFSGISFTKPLDIATVPIMKKHLTRIPFEAEFHFYFGEQKVPFYTIKLKDALISSYSQGNETESITISYSAIEFIYSDGKNTYRFGYDLRKATPL